MRKVILLFVLALVALAAQAQNYYYQSVMPDGRTIVGDKPVPGAKDVKKIPLRAGNISAPLSSPAQPGAAGASAQSQALDTANAEVQSAQQALDAAKTAFEAGREPQPGERIGIAGGGTRLTDAYAQRIKALEDAVTNAQKQLDDALSRRSAAR